MMKVVASVPIYRFTSWYINYITRKRGKKQKKLLEILKEKELH